MRVAYTEPGHPGHWVLCTRCGSVVADQDVHTSWHVAYEDRGPGDASGSAAPYTAPERPGD